MDGDQSAKTMDAGSASASNTQDLTEGIHEKANMKNVIFLHSFLNCKVADLKPCRLPEKRLPVQVKAHLTQRVPLAPSLMVKLPK